MKKFIVTFIALVCFVQIAEAQNQSLHSAAYNNSVADAKKAIANGADVNATDAYDWTPLHYAARNNSVKVAKLLIANGADVNATDGGGETPLHWAAYEYDNSAAIAKLLLANGADVNAKNVSDLTPLQIAEMLNYKAVIKAINSAVAQRKKK